MADFVDLQVRSCFSLLQSSITIDALIAAAKTQGHEALALTDFNTMYGAVSFYRAATAAGIKPLIGLTVQLPGLLAENQQAELIFIARNNHGLHQLFRLSSLKMTTPDLTWAQLATECQDLIVIMPALTSETAAIIDLPAAQQDLWWQQFQPLFAQTPLYWGITTRGQTGAMRRAATKLAAKWQIPLVALDDVRYLTSEDAFTNDVLAAIGQGQQLDQPLIQSQQQGQYYLDPPEVSAQRYQQAELEGAAANTVKIAQQCQVQFDFKRAELPRFPTPAGVSSADYLAQLAQRGLARRLQTKSGVKPGAYQQRLAEELKIIIQMGFADYFLIVWDVIKQAHQLKIMIGPGRGSAAGSLVAYSLGITDVDPLTYQLLFERFLNPERVSMPDIDLDIPDDRRDELIHYMHDHYGDAHMAQIITFGTMAAKQALRDVGRVLGLSQPEMNEWSRAITDSRLDLREAYKHSDGLKNLVATSDRNRLLFVTALKIEGLPRHFSTHAAGIVLSAQALTDTVPVQNGTEDIKLTQFPKGDVEALGLLKMDFLGLRNLTILANTLRSIRQQPGSADFDPHQIPLNDPETMALFQRGDTDGVFQFESGGIRQVLIKLHPTSFADIVATNALYRPGPMENIDTFVARKNGRQPIAYPDPALAPVLHDTYGVLVYQEQVMQVAVLMGGFTMAQADNLRRAVSKKSRSALDAAKEQFLTGAQGQGFSLEVAQTVYDYIERFANYGFNKSHAVAYSMVAVWLAYLKVHYPAPFFLALLNANLNNQQKVANYLQELRGRHIKIHGPDINESRFGFILKGEQVYFGFSSIKGLRRDWCQQILAERQARGRFQSVTDFLKRLPEKLLKTDFLTILAQVGCFDQFDQNRHQTVLNMTDLSESLQLAGSSMPLFDVLAPKVEHVADYDNQTRLSLEKELLGVYVSGHPLSNYTQAFQRARAQTLAQLPPAGQRTTILVYLTGLKTIRTKRGEQMAFLKVEDLTAEMDVTVFPQTYRQSHELLQNGAILLLQGKVDQRAGRQGRAQFIAEQIATVAADQKVATLFLQLTAATDQVAVKQKLEKTLLSHRGLSPVIIHFATTKKNVRLDQRFQVQVSSELLAALAQLLGSDNVVVRN
ncbi:DNA polymerase III subunit alpha [Lapidilactobacillus salsurivasis]